MRPTGVCFGAGASQFDEDCRACIERKRNQPIFHSVAQEKSSVRSAMFIARFTNNDPPSSVGAACSPSAYAKLDARACHAAPTELGWTVDDLGCYKHGAPNGAW